MDVTEIDMRKVLLRESLGYRTLSSLGAKTCVTDYATIENDPLRRTPSNPSSHATLQRECLPLTHSDTTTSRPSSSGLSDCSSRVHSASSSSFSPSPSPLLTHDTRPFYLPASTLLRVFSYLGGAPSLQSVCSRWSGILQKGFPRKQRIIREEPKKTHAKLPIRRFQECKKTEGMHIVTAVAVFPLGSGKKYNVIVTGYRGGVGFVMESGVGGETLAVSLKGVSGDGTVVAFYVTERRKRRHLYVLTSNHSLVLISIPKVSTINSRRLNETPLGSLADYRIARSWQLAGPLGNDNNHTGSIGAVLCSSSLFDRFVTGSSDSTIKLWDATGSQGCITTFSVHTMGVSCLACISEEVDYLYSGGNDGSVKLICLGDNTVQSFEEHRGPILFVGVERLCEMNVAVSLCGDGVLVVRSLFKGGVKAAVCLVESVSGFSMPTEIASLRCKASAGSRLCVAVGHVEGNVTLLKVVVQKGAEGGNCEVRSETTAIPCSSVSAVNHIAVTADGRFVVHATMDGNVVVTTAEQTPLSMAASAGHTITGLATLPQREEAAIPSVVVGTCSRKLSMFAWE